jgi:D-alanine--poly(phosphoribitol) ligase subunit 2|tara:strand:+ start:4479 stop:4730 length:252 start_codon:yes stop_codon:yes gene_type:complete
MEPKMWLINWFEKNSLATGINMKNSLKENYFENGWIDSLKFIELITQIEEKFGIRFSNDEFLDRKFSTIEGLTKIIERKNEKK